MYEVHGQMEINANQCTRNVREYGSQILSSAVCMYCHQNSKHTTHIKCLAHIATKYLAPLRAWLLVTYDTDNMDVCLVVVHSNKVSWAVTCFVISQTQHRQHGRVLSRYNRQLHRLATHMHTGQIR